MANQPKDFTFDKRAAAYDEGFEGRFSRRFYQLLLREVGLFPGACVLDVGCGTGALLRLMADHCAIVGYGVDVEANMIAEAQKKCPEMTIQVAKCEDMPFEDGRFDVLTACMAYHHFSDPKGFAGEAARLLKPGGHLYIADPHFPWLIRKPLNGMFKILGVTGYFSTPRELYDRFGPYGFVPDGWAVDGYAQVVKMRYAGR